MIILIVCFVFLSFLRKDVSDFNYEEYGPFFKNGYVEERNDRMRKRRLCKCSGVVCNYYYQTHNSVQQVVTRMSHHIFYSVMLFSYSFIIPGLSLILQAEMSKLCPKEKAFCIEKALQVTAALHKNQETISELIRILLINARTILHLVANRFSDSSSSVVLQDMRRINLKTFANAATALIA